MTTKGVLNTIGSKFDEKFSFWFADDDYSKMLETSGLKHALIGDALVEHRVGQSHGLWPSHQRHAQTDGMGKVFEEKWKK